MTLKIWIALAVANYIAAVAPGQNIALVGISTARAGVKSGCISMIGIIVADVVWCLLALGLAIEAKGIDADLLLAIRIISGLLLLGCGITIGRRAIQLKHSKQNEVPQRGPVLLMLQGFGIGFASPITLVFFLTMFPALLPDGVLTMDFDTATFFSSAVILSSLVAILPYILASFALSKAGLNKAINLVCGGVIASVGGVLVLQAISAA